MVVKKSKKKSFNSLVVFMFMVLLTVSTVNRDIYGEVYLGFMTVVAALFLLGEKWLNG